jgi:uncharacterized protein (TIRG00374 family)
VNQARLRLGRRLIGGAWARAAAQNVGCAPRRSALLPGIVGAAALWAGVALVTGLLLLWQGVEESRLPAPSILGALVPATVSYLLRLLRWHLLLRRATGPVSLPASLSVQAVGFALAATPGRAGEVLKFFLLERRCGVAAARAGSVLPFERLSDGVGLAAVALLGGALLAQEGHVGDSVLRFLAAPVGLLFLALAIVWRAGRLPAGLRERWHRWAAALEGFLAASRTLLRSAAVPSAVVLTVVARLGDALVVYLVTQAFGLPISYPQAALVLGLAGLAGGISLTPGGLGAAEAAMVALLIGLGATASVGLLATVVVRTFTYWLWVGGGLALLAFAWGWLVKGETDARLTRFDSPQGAERPNRRLGGAG